MSDVALDATAIEQVEPWYKIVGPEERLTQGDLIMRCPLLTWKDTAEVAAGANEVETLKTLREAFVADVVVMTQACDLEQEKVKNVVLCPHLSLSAYKTSFQEDMAQKNQNFTIKAWRNEVDDIKNGYHWNLSLLNSYADNRISQEHRVVYFHELFTVPRSFLDSLIAQRSQSRLQLRPPYREHLSQAFARYFMRVGLPSSIRVEL